MAYNPYTDDANPVAPPGFIKRWAANRGGSGGVFVARRTEAVAILLAKELPTLEPDIGPWIVVPMFVPERYESTADNRED